MKSKQYGVLPFLNQSKECDQINNDRIEVEEPVRDNTKDVCLYKTEQKLESSNEGNDRGSQPMAANVQASQEVNTNLNASMQLEKSPEGEISKVLSSDLIYLKVRMSNRTGKVFHPTRDSYGKIQPGLTPYH